MRGCEGNPKNAQGKTNTYSDKREPWNTVEIGHPISHRIRPSLLAEEDLSEVERGAILECPICYDRMPYLAVGSCYDFVCWMCALKMRSLQGNICCPFCTKEQDFVFLIKSPFTVKDREEYLKSKVNLNSLRVTLQQKTNFNLASYAVNLVDFERKVVYSNASIKLAAMSLFKYICWHPHCTVSLRPARPPRQFETLQDWMKHSEEIHRTAACTVCIRNRKVFLAEAQLFRPSDLPRHFINGDRLINPPTEPHVQCEICTTAFFNLEEYSIHVKAEHISCYICDKICGENKPPSQAPAFNGFDTLEKHYQSDHYSCTTCQYVAFRTETELQLHVLSQHKPAKGRRGNNHHHHTISNNGVDELSSIAAAQVEQTVPQYLPGRNNVEHRSRGRGSYSGGRFQRNEDVNSAAAAAAAAELRPIDMRKPRGGGRSSRQKPIIMKEENLNYWELPMRELHVKDAHSACTRLYTLVQKTTSMQSNQQRMAKKLTVSLENILSKIDFEKMSSLQNDFKKKNIGAALFVKQVMSLIYNSGVADGGGNEPDSWKRWRTMYPQTSAASDVLILLVTSSPDYNQLFDAANDYLADLRADACVQRTVVTEVESEDDDEEVDGANSQWVLKSTPAEQPPEQEDVLDKRTDDGIYCIPSEVRDHTVAPSTNRFANIDLPIGNKVLFIEALSFVITEFIRDMTASECVVVVPKSLVSSIKSFSKRDLDALTGFETYCHEKVNRRAIDRVLSLRATYRLARVQENGVKTWGARCSDALALLNETEMKHVKSYIDELMRHVPQICRLEEYPALPTTTSVVVTTPSTTTTTTTTTINNKMPKMLNKIRMTDRPRVFKSMLASEDHFPSLSLGDNTPVMTTNPSHLTTSGAAGSSFSAATVPRRGFSTLSSAPTSSAPPLPVLPKKSQGEEFPSMGAAANLLPKKVTKKKVATKTATIIIEEHGSSNSCTTCTYDNPVGSTTCQLCGCSLLS